ncbi:MAG: hypothetical protein ACI4MF_10505 [Candidatus Faecivicinus sp.]
MQNKIERIVFPMLIAGILACLTAMLVMALSMPMPRAASYSGAQLVHFCSGGML